MNCPRCDRVAYVVKGTGGRWWRCPCGYQWQTR